MENRRGSRKNSKIRSDQGNRQQPKFAINDLELDFDTVDQNEKQKSYDPYDDPPLEDEELRSVSDQPEAQTSPIRGGTGRNNYGDLSNMEPNSYVEDESEDMTPAEKRGRLTDLQKLFE